MDDFDARHLQERLEPGEQIEVQARAVDATLAVTDRRLAVSDGTRIVLDIPFARLRRIQFDIERLRPATLVVVPEHPTDQAQVLTVPPEAFEPVAQALALVGRRLARPD